ncbi:hypothetical protein J4218_00455 [Candidatus Pacearchaeota archaeon]|nr:hypothetical protein [Candidatus Pacearchaeota archaeon]
MATLDPSLLKELSPELISKLSDLIFVVKAVGVLFIIYAIILIIGGVMGFLRNRRIKKIYEKVNGIDEKLDILLKDRIKKDVKEKDRKKVK